MEYEANNTVEENEADFFNFMDVVVDGELSDFLRNDSDIGDIPLEDGSDVKEELRAFKEERRKKVEEKGC